MQLMSQEMPQMIIKDLEKIINPVCGKSNSYGKKSLTQEAIVWEPVRKPPLF